MNRKVRLELTLAIVMAFVLSALVVYMNQPVQRGDFGAQPRSSQMPESQQQSSSSNVQQTIKENIRGELRKGTFETVVSGLRNLTSQWGGIVPYLSMVYESESWSGTMTCSVPTQNVADFTFGVRKLINDNGKVTYITVSVTETIVNQTGLAENQFSDVSIGLTEPAGGASPILSQVGLVVPWLVNGLVLVVQGLIIGVPLCFVSLGIVIMVDRAIIPAWKKQFKSRGLRKAASVAQREIGVQSGEN